MTRIYKGGVEYFPKDVDFYRNNKIRLLRMEYGMEGVAIFEYILCELYTTNGYFLEWNQMNAYLIADGIGCGVTPKTVGDVVECCVRYSLFDEKIFRKHGVLTSKGIQSRYVRMVCRREYVEMISEYWLLDLNSKKDVPIGTQKILKFVSLKATEKRLKQL